MIFKLNYKKKYEIAHLEIFVNDIDELTHNSLYTISSDKKSFEDFILGLAKNSPSTYKDIFYKFQNFILNNVRLRASDKVSPLYEFSNSKIIVPIHSSENKNDIFTKILGTIPYYAVGIKFNEHFKLLRIPLVANQLTYLISKLNYRPIGSNINLKDINRYILLLLMKTHDDNLNNYKKNLLYSDLMFNLESGYDKFFKENKDKSPEQLLEDISGLLDLSNSSLKQMMVTKYGLDILLVLEDISHFFYLIFLSHVLNYRLVISRTLLSIDESKLFASKSIEYVSVLVDSIEE
ncbi:MAG: hypothetical protein ACPLX8_00125 [Nanopusillaceae archaeon]